MAFFKTDDGCNIYYELIGEGSTKPMITFVNGTLQTTLNWRSVVKHLSHQYRLLLYDGRGQGASDLGDASLSLERHVDDLQDLLYELDIYQSHFVALSHGARVALALADRKPDLVLRVVLCSISTQSTLRARMIVRSWREILQRHSLDAMVWAAVPHVFGRKYLHENEKNLERIVQTIVRRNKTEGLRAHFDALNHYPALAGQLKSLPFLLLVINGEDDPLVTVEGAEEIARICGGRQKELSGIGHSIAAETPEGLAKLVMDFLSEAYR
jgi:pimeloyl-ACP methyl ester carboxylesterase